MNLFFRSLAVLALFAFMGAASGKPVQKHNLIEATAYLQFVDSGHCAGTLIEGGILVTAAHCANRMRLSFGLNGKEAKPLVIVTNDNDVALVRINRAYPVVARLGRAPKQGDAVAFFGHGANVRWLMRVTYVGGATPTDIVLMAPVEPGDSGAGVFNTRGELVAVVTDKGMFGDTVIGVARPITFTPEQWAKVRQ